MQSILNKQQAANEPIIGLGDNSTGARVTKLSSNIEMAKFIASSQTTAANDEPTANDFSAAINTNTIKLLAEVKKISTNTKTIGDEIKAGRETSEEKDERIAREQEQLGYLKTLAGVADKSKPAAAPAAPAEGEGGGGGGLLGGIMSLLSGGLMNALKIIFSPKNLLKAITKAFVPAMIIGSLFNGILDGFIAFVETGSIKEALIAGLGGVLEFLTFGLFDKETIRGLTEAVSGFVEDYIITPVTNFVEGIGEAFDKYIKTPINDSLKYVGELFTDYIVNPLKEIFTPVVDFFTSLKDTVLGFFNDFKIPGIGFSVMGKQFGFGPWYPFRSDKQEAAAAGEASSAPETETKTGIVDTVKSAYKGFGKGTAGSMEAQNMDSEVNARAKESGAIDQAGNIVDADAYSKIQKDVRSEIEAKDPSAFVNSDQRIRSQQTFEEQIAVDAEGKRTTSKKSTMGVASEKAILGSATLGSFASSAGLQVGSFMGTSTDVKDDGNGEVDRSKSTITGKRISGGLFGSDKYTVSDGEVELTVNKTQYKQIQELSVGGKADQAADLFTKLKENQEAKFFYKKGGGAEGVSPSKEPSSGALVSAQSSAAEDAKLDATAPSSQTNNTVVAAPTTINNSRTVTNGVRNPTRNQEPSFNKMLDRRYAY